MGNSPPKIRGSPNRIATVKQNKVAASDDGVHGLHVKLNTIGMVNVLPTCEGDGRGEDQQHESSGSHDRQQTDSLAQRELGGCTAGRKQ